MQHENCVTYKSPGGPKSNVSGDLLKIVGFCKMFWIANNAIQHSKLGNLFISLVWLLLKTLCQVQEIATDKSTSHYMTPLLCVLVVALVFLSELVALTSDLTLKTSFNYCSSGSGQNSMIPVVCDVPE